MLKNIKIDTSSFKSEEIYYSEPKAEKLNRRDTD